ncbi:MAG TPA: EamA family transporter [Propionibacteriaceae bacterium]|nr:EamA family transporter [Propionibacteriaceae bacterium]
MGPFLVLLSAVCFGAMAIFAKFAYEAGISPQVLLMLRFVLAAAMLLLVLLVRPELRRVPQVASSATARPGARPVLIAIGLGAIGYALQSTFYFSALTRIDASLTALVLYTYPVLVTLGAVLMGRERLTTRRVLALLAATAGTVLVLVGVGRLRFDLLGVGLAFGGAVTYTTYILVSDTVVNRLPPVVLTTLVMAGAAVTLSGRVVLTSGLDLRISASGWLWVGCIALVSTVIAMLSFFAGLARTGPSTASILSTFEPVVTTALAALTLHELLTPVQLVGGALVLGAAAVVQLPRRRPAYPPEESAAESAVSYRR